MTKEQKKHKVSHHTIHESVGEYSYARSRHELQRIQSIINEHVALGHNAEIKGNVREAVQNYTESIRMLDEASAILDSSVSRMNVGIDFEHNLNMMKQNVSMRLSSLQTEASHSRSPGSQSQLHKMFSTQSMADFQVLIRKVKRDTADATEIFTIPQGVSVFYITKDGAVKTSYEQFALHIVKFNLERTDAFIPPAFLQVVRVPSSLSRKDQINDAGGNFPLYSGVKAKRKGTFFHPSVCVSWDSHEVGNWLYPLMPGLSPALITIYGAYIFPDILSREEDKAVALVFSLAVTEYERKKFEYILNYYTVLDKARDHENNSSNSDIVSEVKLIPSADTVNTFGLAYMVSYVITLVASVTSWIITIITLLLVWLLKMGSEYIQAQIEPAAEPQRVDPMVQAGISYVKTATVATVKVQQYIVDKLGEGAMTLATNIAPILKEQGEDILPDSLKGSTSEFMKGTAQITSSTLRGVTKVYNSLDNASDSLIKNLTDESFHIIQHRYGEEVGALASDTLSTAQGVVLMARSAKGMNLMRFAASAGKPKGSAALRNHATRANKCSVYNKMATPNKFMRANTKVHENTNNFIEIFEQIGSTRLNTRRGNVILEDDIRKFQRRSIDGVIKTKALTLEKWTPSEHRCSKKKDTDGKKSKVQVDSPSKESPSSSDKSRYSQLSKRIFFDKNIAIAVSNKKLSHSNIIRLLAEHKFKESVSDRDSQSDIDSSQINERKSFKKYTDNFTKRQTSTDNFTKRQSAGSFTKKQTLSDSFTKRQSTHSFAKQQTSQSSVHSSSKHSISSDTENELKMKHSYEKAKTSVRGKKRQTSLSEITSRKTEKPARCRSDISPFGRTEECIIENNHEESDHENIKENNQKHSRHNKIKKSNQEQTGRKNIKENNQEESDHESSKGNNQENSGHKKIKENNQEQSGHKNIKENDQEKSDHESSKGNNQEQSGHKNMK